jgi:hypothetical protein
VSQEFSLDILAVNEAILKAFDLILVLFALDTDILDFLGRFPCEMHLGFLVDRERVCSFICKFRTTWTLESARNLHLSWVI